MALAQHPRIRAAVDKVLKDNITMLASVVAWGVLSSIIPIAVGLIAISGVALHDPTRQRIVIDQLSQALQHVLTADDLRGLVRIAVQHTGLFGLLGVVGVIWGASNVGGAVSTVFQPIFQVRGRALIHEKLLDIGMILIFTVLMLVIITATTAGALLDRFFVNAPFNAAISFAMGTVVSFVAAFLLFFVLYALFPNIESRFKVGNVWKGALIAALLFQILSFVWPLYVVLFHPQRFGSILAPIVVLGVWVYFFSLILVVGAEVVAVAALAEARAVGVRVGPEPDGTVPQRMVELE